MRAELALNLVAVVLIGLLFVLVLSRIPDMIHGCAGGFADCAQPLGE